MSADDLTSFSYVILLLVGSGGAAPHDLLRMHRQGNWIYWTAAESRFYSEPKRLAELGYLNARQRAWADDRPHHLHAHLPRARGNRVVARAALRLHPHPERTRRPPQRRRSR